MITNNINNKKYIGVTTLPIKNRMDQHFNVKRSGCPVLKKAINKYGKENFSWEIIDKADSIEELTKKEIIYIKKYKTLFNENGYNMLPGGFCNEMASKARMNPVIRIDTGETYSSLKEAAQKNNCPSRGISLVLCGRQDSVYGIEFKYIDEEKNKKAISRRFNRIENSKQDYRLIDMENGMVFKNALEASKFYKCCKNTILKHIKNIKTRLRCKLTYIQKDKENKYNKGDFNG